MFVVGRIMYNDNNNNNNNHISIKMDKKFKFH